MPLLVEILLFDSVKKKKSGNHTHLHFYCHANTCVLLFTVSSTIVRTIIFLSFSCPQREGKYTSVYSFEIGCNMYFIKLILLSASRIKVSLYFLHWENSTGLF